LLWKHTDWRINTKQGGLAGVESKRNIRLVFNLIATVGNYEYAYNIYFYVDGTIEPSVKMTGILNTSGTDEESPTYATRLGTNLEAQFHQHWFATRLDVCVDGEKNSVSEINVIPEVKEKNPFGNAFVAKETIFQTELQATRHIEPKTSRYWKVFNPNVLNPRNNKPVAYKLIPGHNSFPMCTEESWQRRRAGFISNHLWVTKYNENEPLYIAGKYTNQSDGTEGIQHWIKKDQKIENEDLVVWYVFGATHIPRLEDWPVMPVEQISYSFKPCCFF